MSHLKGANKLGAKEEINRLWTKTRGRRDEDQKSGPEGLKIKTNDGYTKGQKRAEKHNSTKTKFQVILNTILKPFT
jgi:hypothetical protein